MLQFTVKAEKSLKALYAIQQGVTLASMDKIVHDVAIRVHADVVQHTPPNTSFRTFPGRGFGSTAAAWQIENVSLGVRRVVNAYQGQNRGTPVMRFLEEGTKDHGPVRAKALFIPLTRSVAQTGYRTGMKFGKDFILSKWVKGIKAMHIVRDGTARAQVTLLNAFKAHITNLIK